MQHGGTVTQTRVANVKVYTKTTCQANAKERHTGSKAKRARSRTTQIVEKTRIKIRVTTKIRK